MRVRRNTTRAQSDIKAKRIRVLCAPVKSLTIVVEILAFNRTCCDRVRSYRRVSEKQKRAAARGDGGGCCRRLVCVGWGESTGGGAWWCARVISRGQNRAELRTAFRYRLQYRKHHSSQVWKWNRISAMGWKKLRRGGGAHVKKIWSPSNGRWWWAQANPKANHGGVEQQRHHQSCS